MSKFDRIVEDAIKRAMEAGEFDNLTGMGRPIQWNDNPFAPAEMKLVDDLLKKNDLLYPWMEQRKEIDRLINELKEKINIYRDNDNLNEMDLSHQIAVINKKIFDYNLSVPVFRLQIRSISHGELIDQE